MPKRFHFDYYGLNMAPVGSHHVFQHTPAFVMEMTSPRAVTFPLITIPNFHASSQVNISRQTDFSFCGHHTAWQEFVGEM